MPLSTTSTILKSIRSLRRLSTRYTHWRLRSKLQRTERRLTLLQEETRHLLLKVKELQQLQEMQEHRQTELSPVRPVPVILQLEPEFQQVVLEELEKPLLLDHPLLRELLNLPPQEKSEVPPPLT